MVHQYTFDHFLNSKLILNLVECIKISMDGKIRALDNIYIERFWRTIKYQHIYCSK